MTGLRKAGHQEFIAKGLLARAAFYRIVEEYPQACEDLAEAREIAKMGGMNLYTADYHLEAARLALAEGKTEQFKHHKEEAKKRIHEMQYLRRLDELKELDAGC